MGYVAVQTLVKARAREPVKPEISIDIVAVTASNIDDPAISAKLRQYQQ